MSRIRTPEVLPRPRTAPDAAIPVRPVTVESLMAVPAAAEVASVETPVVDAPAVETPAVPDEPSEPTPPGRARRLTGRRVPHPPGRRGPLWLAALVAGALIAAVPGVLGTDSTVVTVDASDYGLGEAADVGMVGMDADVRAGITEAEARARLSELAASRAARTPKTVVPVEGRLTTCYCFRWGEMHYGLDLAAPLGTPIRAAADGVVLRAGPASGYGNAVYVQDADGNVHIYGHMRYYDVEEGQIVHAGDQIATVGNEGYSTGPHLHWQIHSGGMNGSPLDPEEWLAERDVFIG